MATLQSLDRGLRALSLVSLAPEGLTVAEIATRLGTDRATAYRIVDTLEQHALVTRGVGKRVRLGAGAVVFAYSIPAPAGPRRRTRPPGTRRRRRGGRLPLPGPGG